MADHQRFKDKVVIVTGASSGIGKATALAFSKEGAHVVASDVTESNPPPNSIFVKCDVSKSQDVKNLVQQAVKTYGRLDCAYNNAGIEGSMASFTETTEDDFNRVIHINLKGVWLCMKEQIPIMLKNGGGSIVNCSSIAGIVGFQGAAAYTASKFGVIGLTKAAALEYAKSKIRINAVCPGVIKTPMVDRAVKDNPEMEAQLVAGEPMGRLGTADEIANAVLWLCSDEASFVTGHPLVVDGGWVAQ